MRNASLPTGLFTKEQAKMVTDLYKNIFIEEDHETYFRLVIRNESREIVWRAWNFEPGAGQILNQYIICYGVKK
jgi:hypothetical protein